MNIDSFFLNQIEKKLSKRKQRENKLLVKGSAIFNKNKSVERAKKLKFREFSFYRRPVEDKVKMEISGLVKKKHFKPKKRLFFSNSVEHIANKFRSRIKERLPVLQTKREKERTRVLSNITVLIKPERKRKDPNLGYSVLF